MQMRMVTLIAALTLAGVGVASADPRWDRDRDNGRHNGYSRGQAYGQSDYDYAPVVRVEPLSRRIRVLEPRRECRIETVYDRDRDYRGNYYQGDGDRYAYDRNGNRRGDVGTTNSTIIGGLLGGAVGNQVGRGEGRRIATVAGALIGAAIGHDVGQQRQRDREGSYDDRNGNRYGNRYDDRYDDRYDRGREVERCQIRHEERFEERIDGYRVTYEYNGREYTTRMSYDPGKQVRVRVDVFPDQGY